jgi:transcriptional regulator with XRE-family HTH domain
MIPLDRDKIRKARQDAGITQAEVSARLKHLPPGSNASPSRVSQIETGVIIWVGELEATRLAAAIGIPLSGVLLESAVPVNTLEEVADCMRQGLLYIASARQAVGNRAAAPVRRPAGEPPPDDPPPDDQAKTPVTPAREQPRTAGWPAGRPEPEPMDDDPDQAFSFVSAGEEISQ